jgi:hypothetical protein
VPGADIVGRPRAGALILIAGGRLSLASSRLGVGGQQTLGRWREAGDSDASGGRAGRVVATRGYQRDRIESGFRRLEMTGNTIKMNKYIKNVEKR